MHTDDEYDFDKWILGGRISILPMVFTYIMNRYSASLPWFSSCLDFDKIGEHELVDIGRGSYLIENKGLVTGCHEFFIIYRSVRKPCILATVSDMVRFADDLFSTPAYALAVGADLTLNGLTFSPGNIVEYSCSEYAFRVRSMASVASP